MASELTVIWWRDIPAEVLARAGSEKARAQLTDRFQEAIDIAATRIGLTATDAYLTEWRKVSWACGDNLDAEVRAEAERLEAAFTDEVLDSLARTGGLRSEQDP